MKSIINDGILVLTEEIEKIVLFSDLESSPYKFHYLDINHIKYYQDRFDSLNLKEKKEIINDYTYFKDYLDIEAELLEEYPVYRPLVCWQNGEFFNLEDCNSSESYRYWNGNNYKTIIIENREDFIIDMTDSVNLDKWDGSNFNSGKLGYHEYVEKIEGKDMYLLVKISDYQGSLDKAQLMDLDEILNYLEDNSENEGDFEEEIFLIKNL